MSNLAYLAAVTPNKDFAAVCSLLDFLEPGDPVPEPEEIASTLRIDRDAARFFLVALREAGAIRDA